MTNIISDVIIGYVCSFPIMGKNMNKFQRWLLQRIARTVVVQGNHKNRIIEFYKILMDAAQNEFTEDNKLTLDDFLEDCHTRALKV